MRAVSSMKMRPKKQAKRQNGTKSSGAIAERDPVITSCKAVLDPFGTPKGIAAPLTDGRPSQKFMAKAQTQIALSSGQMFCFMYCGSAANDADQASLVYAIGASTGGNFTTDSTWKSATTGNQQTASGALGRLSTNTPYTAASMTGYDYALVGAGIKFTYEGSELYRGGTLRYIHDQDSRYNHNNIDWLTATTKGAVDFINSAPNTIRQSLNKDNVVEINASHSTNITYYDSNGTSQCSYGTSGVPTSAVIGGVTGSTQFGVQPSMIGYYVNTSGNPISFHIDVVEHWSISAPAIQALQTETYSNVSMAAHVGSLLANTRQAHASLPNVKHVDVAKSTLSAMKSPLGHELLNVGLRAALA